MKHSVLFLLSANDLRVVLSTENDQSDYICASFVDVSCCGLCARYSMPMHTCIMSMHTCSISMHTCIMSMNTCIMSMHACIMSMHAPRMYYVNAHMYIMLMETCIVLIQTCIMSMHTSTVWQCVLFTVESTLHNVSVSQCVCIFLSHYCCLCLPMAGIPPAYCIHGDAGTHDKHDWGLLENDLGAEVCRRCDAHRARGGRAGGHYWSTLYIVDHKDCTNHKYCMIC